MGHLNLSVSALLLCTLSTLTAPAAAQGFGADQTITTSQDFPTSVHAVDLDGDGDLDVVSASANDATIAWYSGSPCSDSRIGSYLR